MSAGASCDPTPDPNHKSEFRYRRHLYLAAREKWPGTNIILLIIRSPVPYSPRNIGTQFMPLEISPFNENNAKIFFWVDTVLPRI